MPTPLPISSNSARALPHRRDYHGPERRTSADHLPWSVLMLDEIDYGVVLVDAQQRVLHANRAARFRLKDDPTLLLDNQDLQCVQESDVLVLASAVEAAATRGLRRMITLGQGESAVGVSVVPMPGQVHGASAVLLMLSRSQVCEPLSAEWFARCHNLTSAESRVLHALCSGREPGDIASALGVALSTVRSQIGTIRAKTGSSSIRQLVHRVAQLPPMVNVLYVPR